MEANGEAMYEETIMEQEQEHTEEYTKLVDYGIDPKVASELDIIYKSGLLSQGEAELDERALDALKEFPAEGGVAVLKEFKESNLEHVSNKSAYLCGVMKTYRQKNKIQGPPNSALEKKPGPDEARIKEILDRTGYALDYTTGQRKYGGPPPDWGDKPQPGAGHEVFCGKIPKEIFEDELIPLFENCGKIWDMRLMMDPLTGLNRGYCFTTFCEREGALQAVQQLDNYEIKPGKRFKVNISVANLRLFVGNIPKMKSREDIMEEFSKLTDNLQEVIIYSCPNMPAKKNRGFAFLEYATHKDASVAKRRIGNGRTRVWGCDVIVDWADPQEEPDQDTMEKVKVLYVRNLKADVSEEQLKETFEPYGKIERVKKIKDYGFVHFEEREHAIAAMEALNGTSLGDSEMDVSLAKPPSENKLKEQRKRQQRRFDDYWGGPPMGGPPMRGGRGMGRGGRGGFGGGMFYDAPYGGGYGDYGGGYADDYFEYGYGYEDDGFGYGGGGGYGGFSQGPRGRGGRGGPMPPGPMGGRGGVGAMGQRPPRGMGPRGGPGGPMARGGAGPLRGPSRGAPRGGGMMGRGGRGTGGGFRGNRGGQQTNGAAAAKRKAPGEDPNAGQLKKARGGAAGGDSWGAQPIAQQPLNNAASQPFYQDSFEQW